MNFWQISELLLGTRSGPKIPAAGHLEGGFFGIYGLGPDLAYISASLKMLILALMAS